MNHLKTLFSSRATKAWIGGLAVFIAPYLVNWLSSLTPESLTASLGQYGLQVSEAGAGLIVGIAGLLAVYLAKNVQD